MSNCCFTRSDLQPAVATREYPKGPVAFSHMPRKKKETAAVAEPTQLGDGSDVPGCSINVAHLAAIEEDLKTVLENPLCDNKH